MSRHGDVTFEWAEDEFTFRLGIGELRKLQEKCDAGPYELLKRLAIGVWRIDDVRETIRLGLIGGGSITTDGKTPNDIRINRLVRDYVDERPWMTNVAVAARILEAALVEPEDDQVPKPAAVEGESKSFQEGSSPSPRSTDGDQSLDTLQPKSKRSRSGSSEPVAPVTP